MERKTEINLFSVKKFLKTKGSFLLYDRETMGINGTTQLQSCPGEKKNPASPLGNYFLFYVIHGVL